MSSDGRTLRGPAVLGADSSDLVIVVPLWHRTSNVARAVESALGATPAAQVILVVSEGDRAVISELKRHTPPGAEVLTVEGEGGGRGDYARKINAGYRASDRPHIFTGADDLLFHAGWYEKAVELLVPPIGVIGTVDGCNNRTMHGDHSTHSLIARWYADAGACVDEDHAIFHEGYWHEYCDDELIRTAMSRSAYTHCFDALVEHLHPLVSKAPDDETYRRGRLRTTRSRSLFRTRCHLWGDRRPSTRRTTTT